MKGKGFRRSQGYMGVGLREEKLRQEDRWEL